MKVYHGSTNIVKSPNLSILNYRTDFGKGFYTTVDFEQAKRWSKIKRERVERFQNSDKVHQYVNVYEYILDDSLKVLSFDGSTKEWLEFVYKNRESNELIHKYDIVIGPVANDNLYQVLVNYENGVYDVEETIKRLKTYVLSNQISFHTQESLKCLKYIETIEIGVDKNG